MKSDLSFNMRYSGKKVAICDHFCHTKPKNTDFYKWYTYFGSEYIKEMCEKCAFRETWGYNYKQQKGFKRWVSGLDL